MKSVGFLASAAFRVGQWGFFRNPKITGEPLLMNANVSLRASAVLPRVHECWASAMPGCVCTTTRPGCPPFLGAPPPSPRLSPWPRHAQHLKPPTSFSAPKGTCTLPTSARLRGRSGKDASKPGNKSSSAHGPKQPDSSTQGGEGTKAREAGQHAQPLPRLDDGKQPPSPAAGSSPMRGRAKPPRPALKTVRAPMFKGMEPEGILRWLEDARRGNGVVRTTGMLAALNELRSARDANPAKNSDIARDPRLSQLLEQVWARWEDDPGSFTNPSVGALGLFAAVEVEVGNRGLREFTAQNISNMAWAFAKAGREASGLFGAVQDEVLGRGLDSFNPQNVSNLVYAFATAGKGTPALYSAVEAWVEVRALGRSALANAGAVEQGQGLFERVYVAAEVGMAEWVAEAVVDQDAANTLWALAVAGRPDSDAARALMVAWTKLTQPTDEDFRLQLNQVCQYILACVDASDHARDRYCSALLERWRDTAMSGKQQPGPSSSDLHLEVSKVLQGMGIAHKNEVPFFHGLSYVDILVDGKVAVEVDGPSHFYQDSGAITAVTLFKRRLLEKGGFRVGAIPYFEWIRLKGRLEQENYLHHKLQGIAQ
eukprot:jgi/Mesvir1/24838/Mv22076-RA.1